MNPSTTSYLNLGIWNILFLHCVNITTAFVNWIEQELRDLHNELKVWKINDSIFFFSYTVITCGWLNSVRKILEVNFQPLPFKKKCYCVIYAYLTMLVCSFSSIFHFYSNLKNKCRSWVIKKFEYSVLCAFKIL